MSGSEPGQAPDLGDLPKPPTQPDPMECCNRGCCPCIFDYYYDALERWETRIRARGLDPDEVRKAMTAASKI